MLLALVIALLPWWLPNAFFFDVAINVGLAAIVCVGLNLLIGYAGQICSAMPASSASAPTARRS